MSNDRNCFHCEYCEMVFNGEYDGTAKSINADIVCEKGYWGIGHYNDAETFTACLDKAEDCSDYNPTKKITMQA